jgi:hypothetical protein
MGFASDGAVAMLDSRRGNRALLCKARRIVIYPNLGRLYVYRWSTRVNPSHCKILRETGKDLRETTATAQHWLLFLDYCVWFYSSSSN